MNTDSCKSLEEKYNQDFNTALDIYENDYSHEDLIEFLKVGTVAQKQAAVLKLEDLFSKSDADVLMRNLTGCDGKIREVVSFRLVEFLKKYPEFFVKYSDIFLEAIIDINGNICRNIIFSLKYLKGYDEFCENFCSKLYINTLNLSKIAKTFDIQEGKYKINKEIFKLYWYLVAILEFIDKFSKEELQQVVLETKDVFDYTIREKTAKIVRELQGIEDFSKIREELKQDQNYYVRRI